MLLSHFLTIYQKEKFLSNSHLFISENIFDLIGESHILNRMRAQKYKIFYGIP